MVECLDTDDIRVQSHLEMPPSSSARSLNERRVNGAEGFFAKKIPRSQKGDMIARFSLDDNSEREIIISSSNLYSLHNYSPEIKQQRKRGEQSAALMDDGYHCCGCCPDWWDEVEGTLKHTLNSIKQVVSAAFK